MCVEALDNAKYKNKGCFEVPSINVKIFDEEKDILEAVVLLNQGKEITLKALATQAGQNVNRCRFIMESLIEEERVKKIITKKLSPKFTRYKYVIVEAE